eukprot:jgi/Phyca11/132082/e_gw1.132.27.1
MCGGHGSVGDSPLQHWPARSCITSIPQLEKLQQAITAMNTKEHYELLARWGDYGCATYGQLKLMENVVTARNRFRLVEATVEWVDKVTFEVDSIVEPFRNKLDITKVRSWLHRKFTKLNRKFTELTLNGYYRKSTNRLSNILILGYATVGDTHNMVWSFLISVKICDYIQAQ